jgi:hypothetical protein
LLEEKSATQVTKSSRSKLEITPTDLPPPAATPPRKISNRPQEEKNSVKSPLQQKKGCNT